MIPMMFSIVMAQRRSGQDEKNALASFGRPYRSWFLPLLEGARLSVDLAKVGVHRLRSPRGALRPTGSFRRFRSDEAAERRHRGNGRFRFRVCADVAAGISVSGNPNARCWRRDHQVWQVARIIPMVACLL